MSEAHRKLEQKLLLLRDKAKNAAQKAGSGCRQAWDKARAAAEKGWGKTRTAAVAGWDKTCAAAGKTRAVIARHPVSPLLYVAVLAVAIGAISFNGMYTRAYVLNVDGVEMGVVADEAQVDAIVGNVETRVASILGEDYAYDGEITLTAAYTANTTLTDADELEDAIFDGVGALVDAYAIAVDGRELGYAATQADLEALLDEIAQPYLDEGVQSYEFLEDVEIFPVELPANMEYDLEELKATLTACSVEEAHYAIQRGDTFNAVAYSLDMTPAQLQNLNPDVSVNKLYVGQELVTQQAVPYLSVQTVVDETYQEPIESPVEYVETADLYIGNTSVKEQGADGVAEINAKVTYVNGVETEREVLSTTVLQEPTTTYMYKGTTPKPATASNGYYQWPVRGTITSNWGYRYIFGSTSYHSGLDIAAPYGTAVKAADGGTVTYAGWQGSYGKLVVITHDNGAQTYYAHNSSLLVSVGDKVYQGQAIARVGMTGTATGYHCHFEIRINGRSVNPLNYL